MAQERGTGVVPVLAFGVVAFLVACLSILDMFLPKPYDGVILNVDAEGLEVRAVVPGSGAATAGIEPGDRIAGVGNEIVRTPADAAKALQRHGIGEYAVYLIERDGKLVEQRVLLGYRRLGSGLYAYECFSGFLFFFIGLYVLLQHPGRSGGSPSRVFFVLCTLFLLFLVCRLRPASYSWFDEVVLTTGTLSMLVLPAAFLHFFLVFPKRLRLSFAAALAEGGSGGAERARGSLGPRLLRFAEHLFNESPAFIRLLYLLPPLLFVVTLTLGAAFEIRLRLVSGAPISSWVLMGDYLVLGLLALLGSLLRTQEGRERRQIATVFAGTVGGVTPFLVLGIVMPSLLRTDRFVFWGVVPLVLVPLTFAYAIVRFHFFDIRVIVRRSLLYTMTTAVVAVAYALGIAAFNLLFRDAAVGRSPFFFLVLAFAILALFDPLRRRLQGPIDRFFFREVYDARRAVEEVSEAVVREFSSDKLEILLATRLSEIMHLEWAVLYRRAGKEYVSTMARRPLPASLPAESLLVTELKRGAGPLRAVDVEPLKQLDPGLRTQLEAFTLGGAPLFVPLATRQQIHAILVLGPKLSGEEFTRDDLQLVRTVANQGSIALENARLVEEKRKQLELEKELEIARRVQFALIPGSLPSPPGWQVAARCRPARQVGGDFYDALGTDDHGAMAYVVGDVSGKSVPGAMLMVATREILQTAALRGAGAEDLFRVANQRLYTPRHRLFVALAYLLLSPDGTGAYALAGQPCPLLRRPAGAVEELPAPAHRLPVGALRDAEWDLLGFTLRPGDLVLLYSDGVTDARSPQGEPFGEDRLREVLAGLDGPPEAIVEGLLAAVDVFSAGAEAYDDLTILAVQWQGVG